MRMRRVLARTAVVSLALPAAALFGATAAEAHCGEPHGTPSATASTGHDMDGMDMGDMDGMDMPMPSESSEASHDGTTCSVHPGGHDGSASVDRPRTAVIGGFGAVNLGVLGTAAVLRRRSRSQNRTRNGRGPRATSASGTRRSAGEESTR